MHHSMYNTSDEWDPVELSQLPSYPSHVTRVMCVCLCSQPLATQVVLKYQNLVKGKNHKMAKFIIKITSPHQNSTKKFGIYRIKAVMEQMMLRDNYQNK